MALEGGQIIEKLLNITGATSSALTTLADSARRDDMTLSKIADTQATVVKLVERMDERIERIDADSSDRTSSAVEQLKQHITLEVARVHTAQANRDAELAKSDRWAKVLVALIGLVGAIVGAVGILIASALTHQAPTIHKAPAAAFESREQGGTQ